MAEKCDAIIVGAGLGGLSAAIRLAGEGLRVVILEKGGHAGGTAAYYEKGGFSFPMGPLGFGNPRLVEDSLSRLGLGGALEYLPLRFQLHALGIMLSLAPPFESLTAGLDELFPSEVQGVSRFFRSVEDINRRLESAYRRGSVPDLNAPERSGAGKFLEGMATDWKLNRILGSIGTQSPTAGMPFIASLWDMLAGEGVVYPTGGFPALIDRLVSALEGSDRCSLRLESGVSRIIVSAGRVVGVKLHDGSWIESPAVISNADVKTTYLELLAPHDIPPAWRRAAIDAKLTASGFHVSLGVKARAVDLSAFDGGSRIIYRGGAASAEEDIHGLDWSSPEVEPAGLARQELEVDLLSAEDPAVAPAGGAVVLIRPAADHSHFARLRAAPGSRAPSYAAYKERLAQALVREVADLLPGLCGAVSVMDVATPLTYEERGGRYRGAIAGWAPDPAQMDDYALGELVRTPVAGLFIAGHQALSWMMLGGIPTALLTGIMAADAVLSGGAPATEVNIPHPPG